MYWPLRLASPPSGPFPKHFLTWPEAAIKLSSRHGRKLAAPEWSGAAAMQQEKAVYTSSRTQPGQAVRWTGRLFYMAALLGLGIFGAYILLRASGATFQNFQQWKNLISGAPMQAPADWIASIGIGMHYFMGAVLVLAWPILFSSRIRARHRVVHRWTGRVYVSAGLLAGVGGMSFILAHHDGGAPHIAFALWGSVMMLSSVMAYLHARAKRFELHRAWAIRLFAMVLGSWIFDLEYRAWEDLAGGAGIGTQGRPGLFDYAINYLFFVPNLLVAEYFIRNKHKQPNKRRALKWVGLAAAAFTGVIFVYAIATVSGTESGKYGKHLLGLFPAW
jgi:predicted membrane protein DUF2306